MDAGKKAVHVKWAGKTIALGTFPPAEAEQKCTKAKALTRAWRSTIRPKPTREWVIQELEKNGVRVVTGGRAGRTASSKNEDDGEEGKSAGTAASANGAAGQRTRTDSDLDTMMQRRSSSIGYSMMDGDMLRRHSSLGLGQSFGLDDVVMPPHRPLVGGASAAAYEAARADHYSSLAAKKRLSDESPRRRSSSIGMGVGPSGMSPGSLTASSNQHYEMLKLHHMNLLNEIQETTLMMNLYQQQQLQQQRQQLQEQENTFDARGTNGAPQLPLSSAGGFEFGSMSGSLADRARGYGGMEPIGRSPSLGLGGSVGPSGSEQLQALLRQQAIADGRAGTDRSPSLGLGSSASTSRPGPESDTQQDVQDQEEEARLLEERLKKVRAEIAARQREAEELEAAKLGGADKKRPSDSEPGEKKEDESRKKRKSSDDVQEV